MIACVGFIEVTFWPPVALTNSLLMKRPVGSVIFFPLGAVRLILRSVMLKDLVEEQKCLLDSEILSLEGTLR